MKIIQIEGKSRESLGKKSSTNLRRNEEVPCVLYGDGSNLHFSAPAKLIRPAIYTPDFHTVELTIDGNKYNAIIKDVQFHSVTDSIEHVDFVKLIADKSVLTQFPVKLEGLAAGVKEGGKLLLKVRKLDVRVKPENIVEKLVVNVTDLDMGKSIRVGDLSFEGVEILNNPGIPVATCEIPRAMRGKSGDEEDGVAAPAGAAAPATEAS
ncbi:MAG: large subunit ribosomal protein L25 [Limisphaerales bacterium]|jgi:large subunit ribosomal protein L25